jgi:hypothetical protein
MKRSILQHFVFLYVLFFAQYVIGIRTESELILLQTDKTKTWIGMEWWIVDKR